MTYRTTGLRTLGYRTTVVGATAGCLLAGFVFAAGCTPEQAATQAAAQAAQAVSQLATTSVTSTVAGQNPKPTKPTPGVKFNGRGGYDARVAQQAALRQAHWIRDHHNQVYRPSYPHPGTTQPTTTQSSTQTSILGR